jgi:hypothetical protein
MHFVVAGAAHEAERAQRGMLAESRAREDHAG